MARTRSNPEAPKPKRQRGFAITVKAFMPMGDGLEAQIATLNVLKELEAGDLSGLGKDVTGVVVTYKQTSRLAEVSK